MQESIASFDKNECNLCHWANKSELNEKIRRRRRRTNLYFNDEKLDTKIYQVLV